MSLPDDHGIDIELDPTGELRYLASSFDLESAAMADTPSSEEDKKRAPSLNLIQSYGNPLSPEEASKAVPIGSNGLIRHAIVVPDDFCVDGKLIGGLIKRDFNAEKGVIKPRRPTLPITNKDLMTSLTKVEGDGGPRYIFNGVLNGWPSLRHFELICLEKKRSLLKGRVKAPHYIMDTLGKAWTPHWSAEKEGKAGVPPNIMDTSTIYRATLRGASWTSLGWSPISPGFIFWYEAHNSQGPRVLYGSDTISKIEDDVCKEVHMISHRYAVDRESPKDKLTYHSLVFLEWENSPFGTVVEGAFLNGIGGYKGKCNWYHDKDEEVTGLYETLPPEMISPWLTKASELRCYDVEAKNLDEMKEYIETYNGGGTATKPRFLDPKYTFSHPARLTYRSRSNIAQYLVNYISRNSGYSETSNNCQTMAADLCSFLAGKKDIVPYHPINRIEYYNRSHLFLYDSSMYEGKKSDSLKGKVAR
mmetsp:Transcript_2926/g.6289  ORF Transcript_2926/g.6289 Transcript_2926/m.6289 type:complete len:474 (-) Transcript_2926:89-1510(-)|eukprot:CAMPEP_0168253068 /NCGR_PEP_ID=MMETSP0141_2-20121125/3970_1 /TAXON_ID=44445 /ORGANISM="Pseudo-nitzschia australis, Strain 10249 10 AB" /LENGTH=473 /DNA_ID=CAMNT_0008189369 /DNA_START=192 /DNA_END=1613 /DNA_ORIENTATION=-